MSDANGLATITALSPEIVENEWNEARQKFVLDNFCGGAPLPDAMAFIETAMRRKLSPEAKQIYLINRRVKNKDTGKYEDRWTPQTGIDGFRIIAERTGRYAGSDEPVFEWATSTTLERATVTVYKMVQSQRCAFSATAYWEEYNPGQGLWGKMPRTMLAKCAEALALRKAFPEDLSGLYTDAEMDQSFVDAPHSVQASVSKERVDPETGEITASEPTPLRQPKQIANKSEAPDWSAFWPWAKQNGIKNESDFQSLTGKPIKGLSPTDARQLAESALETIAEESAEADPDIVDAPSSTTAGDGSSMRRLHAIGKDRGLDHDAIRRAAQFHHPLIESMTDLTERQLTSVGTLIETASDEDVATWTTDWVTDLANAPTRDELDAIARTMAANGITRATHQHLLAAYNVRKLALAKEKRAEPAEQAASFADGIVGESGEDRYTA